jgi:hypothetical protein
MLFTSFLTGVLHMRRLSRKLLVGFAALAAASTVSVNTAQAATFPPNAIGNWHSGRCLGISTNGLAGIWNCTTNPDQTWHWGGSLDPEVTWFRQLINGNNQCLGVQGGSTAVGARVVAWACDGKPNQYWGPDSVTGEAVLKNLNDGYLGVGGVRVSNGAPVVQWSFTGNPDQYWVRNF